MQAQHNAVGWFELYVDDMARAKAFYQAVFQRDMLDLPAMGEDMAMCAFQWLDNAPGAAGALVKSPHMQPGGGGTMVYFSCADCAVEAGRVTQNGGEVLQPKFAIGEYGFAAVVRDPDGNTIGLHSMQ
ncbi:VOC family protein [Hydrogenophaga atypica]|uniref:VOC family protein n=1 Tax=Hydrogenophaga atypica TaxID=249409 RepID=A0ABW2QG48_9BURK